MTDKEMNKLADIIVTRLMSMQGELDKQFLQNAKDMGIALNQEIEIDGIVDQLTRLEEELTQALQGEQYELAHELTQRIEYLKRQQGNN